MNLAELFDRVFEAGKYFPLFTSLLENHRKRNCAASGRRLAFLSQGVFICHFSGDQNIDNLLQNKCVRFKSKQAVGESDALISHLRLLSPSPSQADVTVNYFNSSATK